MGARPVQVYSFADFAGRAPNAPPPGDRLDAQFREHADVIHEIQLAVDRLSGEAVRRADAARAAIDKAVAEELQDIVGRLTADAVNAKANAEEARSALAAVRYETARAAELTDRMEARLSACRSLAAALTSLPAAPAQHEATLPPPSLYVNAGGPYAGDDKGATSTSADYAQVSIDWAEHMPDIIPPNTLAINAITGDHWSSRWWASRAASIVSAIGAVGAIPGTQGVFCEALTITGGGIPNLSKTPAGPVLLVMNGVAFLPVGAQPPFAVSGKVITWLSPIYALFPGTEVAVWYPYAPP